MRRIISRWPLLVAFGLTLTFCLIASWPFIFKHSIGSLVEALEAGTFKAGSEPCCVHPVATERRRSKDGSVRFYKYICKSGGDELHVFFKTPTTTTVNQGSKRDAYTQEAFAAVLYAKGRAKKTYFLNTNDMESFERAETR